MDTAEQYHQFAKECLGYAERAHSDELRKAFLAMSRAWFRAAARLQGVMIPEDVPDILESFSKTA